MRLFQKRFKVISEITSQEKMKKILIIFNRIFLVMSDIIRIFVIEIRNIFSNNFLKTNIMARSNKPNFTRVNSLDELKKMCDGVTKDFFILLNFGMRSSKNVSYDSSTDTFYILNEIDDTEQELNSETIMDEEYTNIGKAIKYGAFYAY